MTCKTTIRMLALLGAAACGPVHLVPDTGDEVLMRFEASAEEGALILLAANDLSQSELDDAVGLDRRAAENIVERRPFATLDALDAVPYVGPSALGKLLAYAESNLAGGEVHGVQEGSEDAVALLELVNTASQDVLDHDVGLDARAAQGIVDERPFDTLEALDAVPYVGPTAFEKLLDHLALDSDCPTGQVLTSDGVSYTSLHDALTHASTGATLELCPGEYTVGPDSFQRDVTLVGQQGATLTGELSIVGPAVALEGIDVVDLTGFRLDSPGALYVSDAEIRDDHQLEYHVSRWAYLELRDVVHTGSVLVVHGDARLIDTVLDGVHLAGGHGSGSLLVADYGVVVMSGGAIVNAPDGGVLMGLMGEAEFDGVDFGLGATENVPWDVGFLFNPAITWWHDEISQVCDGSACEATDP